MASCNALGPLCCVIPFGPSPGDIIIPKPCCPQRCLGPLWAETGFPRVLTTLLTEDEWRLAMVRWERAEFVCFCMSMLLAVLGIVAAYVMMDNVVAPAVHRDTPLISRMITLVGLAQVAQLAHPIVYLIKINTSKAISKDIFQKHSMIFKWCSYGCSSECIAVTLPQGFDAGVVSTLPQGVEAAVVGVPMVGIPVAVGPDHLKGVPDVHKKWNPTTRLENV